MKVSVVRGGGLAGGLLSRMEVASESLAPEDKETLIEKVKAAGVVELSDRAPTGTRHPDDLQVELSVEDEGCVHTVRLNESELPDEVRSLIAWADALPAAEHTVATPGESA
jgi:hypothetical protein